MNDQPDRLPDLPKMKPCIIGIISTPIRKSIPFDGLPRVRSAYSISENVIYMNTNAEPGANLTEILT